MSSFTGINQFDGGDDMTDDDEEDYPDVGSIPQFDGAGDLIELDTPAKTTPNPRVSGGASGLTGTVDLFLDFSFCFGFGSL